MFHKYHESSIMKYKDVKKETFYQKNCYLFPRSTYINL